MNLIIFLFFTVFIPIKISAHFYPNVSSIPSSSIPINSPWNDFKNFTGCHKGIKADGLHKLKKYFQYFGYLNTSYTDFSDQFDGNFENAVLTYQQNFRLNTTGLLDNQTLTHIVQPRCGNPDIVNGTSAMYSSHSANSVGTVAHYTFFPNTPRWPRNRRNLLYAFASENQLSPTVRAVFARAFERWAAVVPMTFTETNAYSRADIRIGFFNQDHGDGEPFDGVLGTLAHAFAPPVGRFHLDGEENWVIDGDFSNASPYSAIDLESVAVHEIGHLLGLGHSSVEAAIMYPSIASGVRKVELDNDDVAGVQELYGANPNYNGTNPSSNPRGERDVNGANGLSIPTWGVLLVAGIFCFL